MNDKSWLEDISDFSRSMDIGPIVAFAMLIFMIVGLPLIAWMQAEEEVGEERFIFLRQERFGDSTFSLYKDSLSGACWGKIPTSDSIFGPIPCEQPK